ncbi:type II toxin-antitoxin system MqsR family toxin [Pseudomonas sp. SDO528_S397]
MEKYTPHYDLAVIKADVRRLGARAFTRTAKTTGRGLNLDISEMQAIVFDLQNSLFYKSMTSYADHRTWHDVYPTHSHGLEIYLKVTYCSGSHPPVISFKRMNP